MEWKRQYAELGNSWVEWVTQTSDNGYLLAGMTEPARAETYFLVAKTDSLGSIEWNEVLPDTRNCNLRSAALLPEGGLVLVGSHSDSDGTNGYVLALDARGRKRWERSIGDSSDQSVCSVRPASDGSLVITAYDARRGEYVARLDSEGQLLWRRSISDGGHGWYRQMGPKALPLCQTSDGGFVTAVLRDSIGLRLEKLDSGGNPIWTSTFAQESLEEAGSICTTADSGYLIVGDLMPSEGTLAKGEYLLKTDQNGRELWVQHPRELTGGFSTSMNPLKDGAIISAGIPTAREKQSGRILRTDALGNLRWTMTVHVKPDTGYAAWVAPTKDGGYIVAGTTVLGLPDRDEIYVLKLGPDGR